MVALSGPARAQDKGLSAGHPIRLSDAFPIATDEGAILISAGVILPRSGSSRGFFPVEVQYGPHAGDLEASVRVNFGLETPILPMFAASVGVTFPTGVHSRAFGFAVDAFATKSLTRSAFLHLNAGADIVDRPQSGERRARYRVALGPSLTLPHLATVTLAADVFAEQAAQHGEPTTVGIEAGFRQRATADVYWDVGAGTELAGPGNRAVFFLNVGFTIAFQLGR